MFRRVRAIANENTLPSLLEVRFGSFLMRNVDKHEATKNANVCKALSAVCLSLFRN